MVIQIVALSLLVAAVTAAPQLNRCPTPPTVPEFHFGEYSGVWYEIAKFPDPLETDEKCISEEYHIYVNGSITVVHRYIDSVTLESKAIQGHALIIDVNDLSKLTFEMDNSPVRQPFWVIDTDYISRALVYSCTYENEKLQQGVKIYSRDRTMAPKDYQHMLNVMRTYGINPKDLKKTDQTSCGSPTDY